jgi:tetratricopeptide (TPR) repeat protein
VSGAPDDHDAAIARLFDAALEQPPAAREAWLEARADATPAMRASVQALLRAHAREGILDRSPLEGLAGDVAPRLAAALADRYTLLRQIGRGGMALVFLAHEHKHGREVVLKVLRPELALAAGPERFLREVQLAARLAHPNILGLIDSGEADGLLFYVMPRVEGETLRARLAREGALPAADALVLLRDIAAALAHAHAEGVVHRDLKPDNVLCAGGHAYLMDFGVAKVLADLPTDERITDSGHAVGTVGYMAPEQAAGDLETDERADVFAWGTLSHEVLMGGVAPLGLPAATLVERMRRVAPELPLGLAELVADCVAVRPEDRPQTAAAVLARLEAPPARAVTPPPFELLPEPGRRRRTALTIAGLALAAAIASVVLVRRERLHEPVETGSAAGTSIAQPVAVAELRNETGDTALASLGRLAGDWLTQGLQEVGTITVVPWPTAREAWERSGGAEGALPRFGRATAAGTVVTGAYYAIGDSLRFQLQLVDARTGALLTALPPVAGARQAPERLVGELRERLMGNVALSTDARLEALPELARHPPTYAAYRHFERGLRLSDELRYDESAAAFAAAHAEDTTFAAALLYEAIARWNGSDAPIADSLVRRLRGSALALSPFQAAWLEHLGARLEGDGARALQAIRRATELAPAAVARYNLARTALAMNRPREALDALLQIDPDRADVREWSPYWTALAHAHHLLGDHAAERRSTLEMRRRFPERRVARVLEARALAAAGDTAALRAHLDEGATLPPDTYWSHAAELVVSADELIAHGMPDAGRPLLQRAERWLANQLARDPGHAAHRYWLGSALYDAGRYAESAAYFETLRRDDPERWDNIAMLALLAAHQGDTAAAGRLAARPKRFTHGSQTVYLARIALVEGDRDRGILLLSQALQEGVENWPWLHAAAWPELGRLAGDARGEAVIYGGAQP